MNERYFQSEEMLEKVLSIIPLASQTFSKSKVQFPHGATPFFISRGKGSQVWDVDGNQYTDFINGLLSVMLGYADEEVDQAVKNQLQSGVSFSLPHPIEYEVAKKIVEMVPCAEMVRFGKNGSDATAGAIRLARAFTGRDHVAVCGYHGWQDWYIGSTARNLGVPKATQALTHQFIYNDIEKLEKIFADYPEQIAAVIMEPMNIEFPKEGYLQAVKELAHKYGALFIFDETITGFRFARGGAQEYFGVTPDLATFGKGVGNGFPISMVTGRRDIMMLMEDIFFSFTFGGEAVSLAASLAVMNKIDSHGVIEKIAHLGNCVIDGVKHLIDKHNVSSFISIKGHPSWSFLTFQDSGDYSSLEIKTLWMQEIMKRGVLSFGTHNISYAHSLEDVALLMRVYDEVFPLLQAAIVNNNLEQCLECETLKPLFSVRNLSD